MIKDIFIVALLFVLAVGAFLYLDKDKKPKEFGVIDTPMVTETQAPTMEPQPEGKLGEKVEVTGIINKERIPEDLSLGEFWYWIYFDEPYYLADNASGLPQNVDKMQVNISPTIDFEKILDKHIKLTGRLTWGYAESRVIEPEKIEEIN